MKSPFRLGALPVGPGERVVVVAELSANHRHDREELCRPVRAAKECGADAVKLQTYTADTLTIPSTQEGFVLRDGTPWDGRNLHDLYGEAFTPWEWLPRAQEVAREVGIELFSTAFDPTAVAFLERHGVPAHKVASFEIVDIPLVEAMARTGKPLMLSTGMASQEEVADALSAARSAGARELLLLKCTSAYPAKPSEMNLRAIPHLARTFGVPVGLSDHTLDAVVPVTAVALGACLVEKHFTLSRSIPGPDAAFSLEPAELRAMIEAIRVAEAALGEERCVLGDREAKNRAFRRSLFVVAPVRAGERFTAANVRSIRPGHGLAPKHLPEVLGRIAARDLAPGTPLAWDLVR